MGAKRRSSRLVGQLFSQSDRGNRVAERFYCLPQRDRIEEKVRASSRGTPSDAEIRIATIIIDANVKVHAPRLSNCLRERLPRHDRCVE
jgi:hypothetical protein